MPSQLSTGNQNGSFSLPAQGLRFPFNIEAAVASLPVFCASPGQAQVIDTLLEFLIQEGYMHTTRACPTTQQQGGSNVILANQSFEDQISVPVGSFLTMIGGICTKSSDGSFGTFRVKFYDAGAQAATSDGYMGSDTTTGRFTQLPQTGGGMLTTVSANKNLFILPSPLSITSPGQLNVNITNLESETVTIEMAFIFAAPIHMSSIEVKGAVIGNSVSR